MAYQEKDRDDALIDLGAASIETKGNFIVKQDVDPGNRDMIGLSADD